MKDFPKISIITPSFNQGAYLQRTILSVLEQQYPNIQYIIIDGGSTDNSVEIIQKYDSRINYWVSENDRGQSHALNKGFNKATGDIVAWINSDDWYEGDTFQHVAEQFRSGGARVLVGNCTRLYADDLDNKVIDKPGIVRFEQMLRYWQDFFCPPQPSIFFTHEILDKVGFLDESLNYAMDLDLWLRMARITDFNYTDRNLSYYLIHESSKSGTSNGYKTFVPEWKKVSTRHLRHASISEMLRFYYDYYHYKLNTLGK